MNKRMLLCTVVLTVVCAAGSTSWGFGFLGPPQSTSTKGQLGANLGYTCTKNDIRLKDVKWGTTAYSAMTVHKFSSQTVFADLTYGAFTNWEVFLRGGATDFGEGGGSSQGRHRLTGDSEFTWGWGIRGTFYENPEIAWGGTFQMNAIDFDGRMELGTSRGHIGVDGWEYILSVGPTWNMTERCSLYGGPFLHFMQGDLTGWVDGSRYSADIETEAFIGAMIGLQVDICSNSKFCFEYARSNNVDSISLACGYRH